jgi:hydrogenase expression/formation protein HypE
MKNDIITLAHGGGGVRTYQLITTVIQKHFGNPVLDTLDDSALVKSPGEILAFTTDSYVVNPLFFPGGDIGKLAACGTINDLAMQGAEPKYLSVGLILEEGLAIADLDAILASMASVLKETGTICATGDTKVVERGKGNGIFINTAGIGVARKNRTFSVANAQPGDTVILTGTIGDHGMAVMSRREGLAFQSPIVSDCAPLWDLVRPVIDAVASLRVLRDPTRGGVAAALCDIAHASRAGIRILEPSLPVNKAVRGACDLLGLDPLHVANEGKAILVCGAQEALRALELLHSHPLGRGARIIGTVVERHPGVVILETAICGERIVEMGSGEDLPRIC